MSGSETPAGATLAELFERADPKGPRRLGELVERLAVEGRLRAVLLDGEPAEPGAVAEVAIGGLDDDSRLIRPDELFVALPGEHVDGHDFAAAAVRSGAPAVVVERPLTGLPGIQLVVDRGATALASAACWWYGDPSHELDVVGVTGTDGKTTTTFLVTAALEAAGIRTGLVGTIETRVGPVRERVAAHGTTPGAIRLQRLLRAMVVTGDRAAVIETTSHGLAAERVGGVAYDAAILTNLTHEHLEFHGTFEAYRAAKLSLFERLGAVRPRRAGERPRLGIVNADDPAAARFSDATRAAGARSVTYGVATEADVRATAIAESGDRLRFDIRAPDWSEPIALRLAGRFNVHNALAAVGLGVGWGLDPAAVRKGLESVERVPGRMERVERGQPFRVVVDFAHSPAALQVVLDLLGPAARASGGGVIAVFGSAGERDTEKRPMMGRVAGERCRLVVVTDEDPRGEDRDAILEAIADGAAAVGLRRGSDLLLIADRATAISTAFARARPGDIVLLAGKGHEQTIDGPEGSIPWDERAEAERALADLGFDGPP